MDKNTELKEVDKAFLIWFNENNKPMNYYDLLKETFTAGFYVGRNQSGSQDNSGVLSGKLESKE